MSRDLLMIDANLLKVCSGTGNSGELFLQPSVVNRNFLPYIITMQSLYVLQDHSSIMR